jgi:hypothetical protein
MNFPKREIVERIKKQYPVGCRVELIHMDDPYTKIPEGTKGTVEVVDDTATIHVKWDNGSHLGIVYGEDSCRKLDSVTTICYGKEDVWDSRKDAIAHFEEGIMMSDGSEQDRYVKIVTELKLGMEVATDEY